MSYALLFSGQGTQHPGMLPWLADDELVQATCDRLGVRDWRSALQAPSWAEANRHAQLLLTGTALAAWGQLAARLPAPKVLAGYSVGELAAFSAAGWFDPYCALDFAEARAAAMDRAAALQPGGLLAVVGLDAQTTERLGLAAGAAVAIRNGGDQLILGGANDALQRAEQALAPLGARCTRLRVGVASHTPAMQGAADEFARHLAHSKFARPKTVLLSNATAERVSDEANARRVLAAQMASTLRWDECLEAVQARQIHCVLEIGAGQALARLWSARWPHIPARSADDFRSVQALVDWLLEAESG